MNSSRHWTYGPYRREETSPDTLERRVVDGVRIRDSSRRLTYAVTLAAGGRGPRIRTLEIVPDAPTGSLTPADLGRIPLATLAEHAALYLDTRREVRDLAQDTDLDDADAMELLGDVSRSLARALHTDGGLRPRYDVPDSTTLARMMREEGYSRARLAAHFQRSTSTISDWIGRAYREVPDLMPPRGRGRRPANRTNVDGQANAKEANDT